MVGYCINFLTMPILYWLIAFIPKNDHLTLEPDQILEYGLKSKPINKFNTNINSFEYIICLKYYGKNYLMIQKGV